MGLSELVSFLLGVLTELAAKPVFYGVGGWLMMLFSDVPRISGAWRTTYEEPASGTAGTATVAENLELHQFGRLIWGKGTISDAAGTRKFRYRGRIIRNALLAEYSGVSRNVSVGSGAMQVKINDRGDTLTGWCFWHDKDSERIEASRYIATKTRT